MATNVILPALGMSQETGKILQWFKTEGEQVTRGEPLVEIETDKAVEEIDAPADGVLTQITAGAGDDVPVGNVIAVILAPGEVSSHIAHTQPPEASGQGTISASPLASRIAAESNVDLRQVRATGRRIQKADVLTYLQNQNNAAASVKSPARLAMASPKARRLAAEQGKDLAQIKGSGPGGAVLAADVLQLTAQSAPVLSQVVEAGNGAIAASQAHTLALSNVWKVMAERTAQSWTSVPHFYLVREVNASRLIAWRTQVLKRIGEKVTYSDLLIKIVAEALHIHPQVNASWQEGTLTLKQDIHIGLAVATEGGLVVPVIHHADTLTLHAIASQRKDLIAKAQAGKLKLHEMSDGTFTISNLGMYGVDAFNAIINQPQAAILAVGRIADRVVPVNGHPAVQPMIVLTLSCDHRVLDGAQGAQFLTTLAELIEEPLGLLS